MVIKYVKGNGFESLTRLWCVGWNIKERKGEG